MLQAVIYHPRLLRNTNNPHSERIRQNESTPWINKAYNDDYIVYEIKIRPKMRVNIARISKLTAVIGMAALTRVERLENEMLGVLAVVLLP